MAIGVHDFVLQMYSNWWPFLSKCFHNIILCQLPTDVGGCVMTKQINLNIITCFSIHTFFFKNIITDVGGSVGWLNGIKYFFFLVFVAKGDPTFFLGLIGLYPL